MSQIDFAVAILMMISILTYSIISVSSKLTNDFNTFTTKKLEESASSLSKQLFKIQDDKSLISNFKKIQVSFQEIGGYLHSNPEQMNISITPVVNKIHVYDNFLNEIPSTNYTTPDNITVSFYLGFSSNEKKYVNIFYDGAPTSKINYTSNVTETNITSVILSEEDVYVLSNESCSRLKSLSYDEARNQYGFLDNFNVSECDYGIEIPLSANVIVKSVPLLIERQDGTVYSNFVKLKVW
jgi:hypothetical protein